MTINLEYLYQRHAYWLHRIGETGVWDTSLFLPVEIKIRKHHRRYNGLFQRTTKIRNGIREITDRIIIYNKTEDTSAFFIDNVLVHEMIHQFIIQNGIKDTSAHGRVFKSLMTAINRKFPEELSIKLKDNNPDLPTKGAGDTRHTLLLLYMNDDSCICAVVNPSKTAYFENQLKRNKRLWNIHRHEWAESNDVFFNRFSRCTSRLHGMRKRMAEMPDFCREYNIRSVEVPDKSSPRKRRWGFLRRN